MKKLVFAAALVLSACATTNRTSTGSATWPSGLPVYDHVVIVVEENKDYDEIIGSSNAPYINSLAGQGACFTAMYGEEHHLRFLDFPQSYDELPTVSFVIPNLYHDMHSATIQDGDTWLQQNLAVLRDFNVLFDADGGYFGLRWTGPANSPQGGLGPGPQTSP